jgi:molybdopterin-guanine dinucleotide biosynthesis protein B
MHELRDESEQTLRELVAHLSPVDLVIVEGFKTERHPKIEVHRSEVGKPLLFPDDPNIFAIATDAPLKDARVPAANLDDIEAIADFVDKFARSYAA